MIREIELRHFKCFERLLLPFGTLTVISGANAAGKSTAIQPLVLLHQTMHDHEWSDRLALNGRAMRLGTVSEVVNREQGRGGFEIGIERSTGTSIRWTFAGDRPDLSMHVQAVSVDEENWRREEGKTAFRYLLPDRLRASPKVSELVEQLRSLAFLAAERIGPREMYPLRGAAAAGGPDPIGEHAPGLLYTRADERVLPGLALPEIAPRRLRQVEGHMGRFFPGCRVEAEKVPRASAVMLRLGTSPGAELDTPAHTGFGLTQVLAIVIAALSSSEGGLLIVENPEVHLHPAGQAMMGRFLADVAAAGVQVIVETHSDHVLNGIRRAVKTDLLGHDQVQLHFFRRTGGEESGVPQVESPGLDAEGRIDYWPEGFFDQFDKDSSFFAGWD